MGRRLISLACAASLLALGCSGSDEDDDASTGGDPAGADGGATEPVEVPDLDFSAFDAAVEARLAQYGFPGATAAVVHVDYGLVHSAGYGDFVVDRVSLFASSSKIISAGVVARQVDEGVLDFDAPISDYLGANDAKGSITLAQLLSNSSGLPSLTQQPFYVPYGCQYDSTFTLEDCTRTLYDTTDDAGDLLAPDTEFHYGGAQWQLAGGIAAVASGKTWAELLNETYVEPCGVDTLGYGNPTLEAIMMAGNDVGAAFAYPDFVMGDPSNLTSTENPNIEGGGYASAEHYGQILLMHLRNGACDDGTALSETGVERMQEDRIASYGAVAAQFSADDQVGLEGYGLGWWVDRNNPGIFVDKGLYGATPWLDVSRGYGAIIIVEQDLLDVAELREGTQEALEALFDPI